VLSTLGLSGLRPGLSPAFIFGAIVPLMILLMGNVLCGYLCPFGALQELLAAATPKKLRLEPGVLVRRYGRCGRYVLLFLLVLMFGVGLDAGIGNVDPLTTFFGENRTGWVLTLAICLFVVNFFYERFWCRFLCPAGAFLAMLNRLRLLKRFLPLTRPGRCPYDVMSVNDSDCIMCDRCREPGTATATCRNAGQTKGRSYPALICALLIVMFALLIANRAFQTWKEALAEPAARVGPAHVVSSRARDVDRREIERLIERGRLSDQEALYYEPVE